jgi:hypothetical protein
MIKLNYFLNLKKTEKIKLKNFLIKYLFIDLNNLFINTFLLKKEAKIKD